MKNSPQIAIIRFLFFINILVSDYGINCADFVKWHPLLTQYFYISLPNFFYELTVLVAIKYLFLASSLFCALGFQVRLFSILAFLSGTAFYFTLHSVGLQDHPRYLVYQVLMLFALFENCKSLTTKQFIFLVQLSLALVFFQAGFTKIKKLGFDWARQEVSFDYLQFLRLAFSPYRFDLERGAFNLFLVRNYDYIKYFIYLVPTLELLAPLTLFRRFRFFYLFFIVLQVGIYYGMFISFIHFAGTYAFFVIPSLDELRVKIQTYLRKKQDTIQYRLYIHSVKI